MLAEFGEIADQQLAKGKPVSPLGGLRSGKSYLEPPEDNGASGGPEIEESVEELAGVDKPSKERQKVLPVDCTALGKAILDSTVVLYNSEACQSPGVI
jgi:hypothetical protein